MSTYDVARRTFLRKTASRGAGVAAAVSGGSWLKPIFQSAQDEIQLHELEHIYATIFRNPSVSWLEAPDYTDWRHRDITYFEVGMWSRIGPDRYVPIQGSWSSMEKFPGDCMRYGNKKRREESKLSL